MSGSLCLKGDSKDHDAAEEDVRIMMLEMRKSGS